MLQLTCARTGASLDSLRHQLAQMKEQAGKNTMEASSELAQLQTDVGTLERRLTEKVCQCGV